MKSWSRLCFLVLAISSFSRGKTETVVNRSTGPEVTATPAPFTDETQDEANGTTEASSPPQTNTSANAADRPSTVWTPPGAETSGTTGEVKASASSSTKPNGDEDVTSAAGSSPPPGTCRGGSRPASPRLASCLPNHNPHRLTGSN